MHFSKSYKKILIFIWILISNYKFFYYMAVLVILNGSFSFPGGSDGKESAYNVGELGSIPGSGRSPEEGNSNPLQYSCLENLMDGRAW